MLLNCGPGELLLKVPWTARRSNLANSKGNQSWIFIGRIDAEAEAPILWPPGTKNWLIGRDPDAEKDWAQEKGVTEDKMIGWHHQLNGHEFKQTLGDGKEYGSLVWCNSWGLRELDMTEQLHNNRAITFARPALQWCACCCCWVASVVSDSVRPHRRQPTRLPIAGILQARTLEWGAISFSNAWRKWNVKAKSLSHVRLLAIPWIAAYQVPPSMGFSCKSAGVGCHCLLS